MYGRKIIIRVYDVCKIRPFTFLFDFFLLSLLQIKIIYIGELIFASSSSLIVASHFRFDELFLTVFTILIFTTRRSRDFHFIVCFFRQLFAYLGTPKYFYTLYTWRHPLFPRIISSGSPTYR